MQELKPILCAQCNDVINHPACALDKSIMPLIDMLIQSNKSQSETIKTLTADNLQLMAQIEKGEANEG